MNKTEARYAEQLQLRLLAGEVAWFAYEALTLKLAPDTRYTPDFVVMLSDGTLECHEVKGFFRDDAKVKVKVAAEKFPLRFVVARERPKKLGGGWEVTRY
jgi:hypothetical protein